MRSVHLPEDLREFLDVLAASPELLFSSFFGSLRFVYCPGNHRYKMTHLLIIRPLPTIDKVRMRILSFSFNTWLVLKSRYLGKYVCIVIIIFFFNASYS